jgi:hypothetical protein
MSARTPASVVAPLLAGLVDEARAEAARPFRGITVPTTLARISPSADTAPITEAGMAFIDSLTSEQRAKASFPIEASERRIWFNVHPNVTRHGLLLEDLTPTQRARAMSIIEATLSARGYAQARNVMRINGFLVGLTGRPEEFGEWPYFFSIFGTPDRDEPWGWQIDGHHLNLNVFGADPGRRNHRLRPRSQRWACLHAIARRHTVCQGSAASFDPPGRFAEGDVGHSRGPYPCRRLPRQRCDRTRRYPR